MEQNHPNIRHNESADTHRKADIDAAEPTRNVRHITGIDAHAHVFVRGLPLAPTRRHAPDYDATLTAYSALLQRHAISHAVLVQPSFLGTDNSFFLDVLKRFPDRFRGVAVVDP